MGDTLYNPTEDQEQEVTEPAQPSSEDKKVNPQIVDAIALNSVQTIAASASFAMANLYQHQINHTRRIESMTEAHLGKVLNRFASIDPVESIATAKLFQGESNSSISSLLTQLAAGQQAAKVAQSTPGDLALEVSKINSIASTLQGLYGGLLAMLQTTLASVGKAPAATPVTTPATAQSQIDFPEISYSQSVEGQKYPTVTIRY